MGRAVEVLTGVGIFLLAFWLWSIPISDIPFGDVDSSTHFGLADAMSQSDTPLYDLPFHLEQQYGFANNGFIWYPPQYHTNLAITQLLTGSRFIAPYLFNALITSFMALTTFILIRYLYGYWAATLAALLVTFSFRDIMYYTLGLWPQTASFALLPLVLYAYFRYIQSYEHNQPKGSYLAIAAALLALQFAFHPHPMIHSVAAIGIYTLIWIFQNKKLPFTIKHFVIAAGVGLLFLLPNLQFAFSEATGVGGGIQVQNLGRIFSWYPSYAEFGAGYPQSFFTYSDAHKIWTLPLLFIGIAAVALRRKAKDWLMISWLASFYVMIHLDMFGLGERIPRSLGGEAAIFAPLIAIGLLAIPTFLKSKSTTFKNGLIATFIILTIVFNALPMHKIVSESYTGHQRMNADEIEAVNWIKENAPGEYQSYLVGAEPLAKRKWMRMLSFHPLLYPQGIPPPESNPPGLAESSIIIVDYSLWTGNQGAIAALQQWEQGQPQYVSSNGLVKVFYRETQE